MRWSSQCANGWVAAEPIVSPFASAVSRTRRRSSSSWPAASPALRQTSVEISSTDWISSGFTWPSVSCGTASIISSIAGTSSIECRSTIISSSSTPRV